MTPKMNIRDAANIAGMMAHIKALTPEEITDAKEIRARLEKENENHARYCTQSPEVKIVNVALQQLRGVLN